MKNDKSHARSKNYKGKGSRKAQNPRGNQKINDDRTDSCNPGGNHIEWYNNIPQLVQDTASVSFPMAAGLGHELKVGTNSTKMFFPGIVAAEFMPVPGIADSATDPVNIAARNLYSYIRHANSGTPVGDAQDTMMYILAVDSAYTWYYTLVRLYGVLNLYSGVNRYFGESLVRAMGFQWSDLIKNMPNLRSHINVLAYRLGSLCVPKGMPIFNRHAHLALNYFTDSDTGKGQIYLYRPANLWRYDEKFSEEGAVLRLIDGYGNASRGMNLTDIIYVTEQILSPLLSSEDLGILSGDIRKAYGEANLLGVSTIPVDFQIYPVLDENVRMQFENAHIFYADLSSDVSTHESKGWIIETDVDTQCVHFTPSLEGLSAAEQDLNTFLPSRWFLNMHSSSVSADDVMVATRFMAPVGTPDFDGYWPILSCGSEVLTMAHIYTLNDAGQPISTTFSTMITAPDTDNLLTLMWNVLPTISCVRRHPLIYLFRKTGEANAELKIIGDVDNITTLEPTSISNMHMTALTSLYGSPTMGAFLVK